MEDSSESDDFRYMGCINILRGLMNRPLKIVLKILTKLWSTEFISILSSIGEHMTDNRIKSEKSTFRGNFSKLFLQTPQNVYTDEI